MPAKEIKELRQDGKIEEAYAMAKAELLNDPSNIWGKRNISWVLYSQLNSYKISYINLFCIIGNLLCSNSVPTLTSFGEISFPSFVINEWSSVTSTKPV